MRFPIKIACLLAALASPLLAGPPPPQVADSEDELKAATVWLFVQYAHLTPAAGRAITVGILGRPSFGQVLRRTLENKTAGGHPVRVVEAKPGCCQVVYLATDRSDELQRALQDTPSHGPLTIGESDRFLDYGGAVNLFIADGRIRFETSLDALDRCGVSISANLLKFGQIRKRAKGPASK